MFNQFGGKANSQTEDRSATAFPAAKIAQPEPEKTRIYEFESPLD